MGNDVHEKAIEVAGTKMRMLETGQGAAVLFLHGADGLSFNPLLEKLGERFRVLAPEHPGFGRSPIPEWMMSASDVAFHYLDVLEALKLRDVHLLGHGLGGWIAAELAIRNTGRLATLTLLAPAGVAHADHPFDDIFAWGAQERARRQFHEPRLAEEWRAAQSALGIDIVLQNQTAAARLAWNPRLSNPQLPYWLHRIDVPTLLVWGEDDRVIPFACRQAFLREIAGAELFALPRSGHALPIERAAEIAPRLIAFLQGARG